MIKDKEKDKKRCEYESFVTIMWWTERKRFFW